MGKAPGGHYPRMQVHIYLSLKNIYTLELVDVVVVLLNLSHPESCFVLLLTPYIGHSLAKLINCFCHMYVYITMTSYLL